MYPCLGGNCVCKICIQVNGALKTTSWGLWICFCQGGAAEIIEINGSTMQKNILSQIIVGALQHCFKSFEELKETYNQDNRDFLYSYSSMIAYLRWPPEVTGCQSNLLYPLNVYFLVQCLQGWNSRFVWGGGLGRTFKGEEYSRLIGEILWTIRDGQHSKHFINRSSLKWTINI